MNSKSWYIQFLLLLCHEGHKNFFSLSKFCPEVKSVEFSKRKWKDVNKARKQTHHKSEGLWKINQDKSGSYVNLQYPLHFLRMQFSTLVYNYNEIACLK